MEMLFKAFKVGQKGQELWNLVCMKYPGNLLCLSKCAVCNQSSWSETGSHKAMRFHMISTTIVLISLSWHNIFLSDWQDHITQNWIDDWTLPLF